MLSAITTTKNAAATLARCLASVNFADEKIVVDSASTDETAKIAQSHSARVINQDWLGYGPQKNVGLETAHGDWLLFIDADEEVTSELQQAIKQAMAKPDHDFYWVKIITIFLGKPLKHLYGHNPRFFRKNAGRWTTDKVHEQVQAADGTRIRLHDDRSAVLAGTLLHYSHPTIRSYLTKMHHYTTLDAEQMRLTNKHRSGRAVTKSPLLPWRLASRQFIKLFFYRHGWLDSYAGWLWCALSAYYEWEMGYKYLRR